MRSEIESGVIGRPIRLRLAHRDTRAVRPGGFADQPYLAVMPRLILMDMGCHLIDTARYLMGEIETVSATIGRFGEGNAGEDVAMLAVSFAGGALGWLDFSWCAVPRPGPARVGVERVGGRRIGGHVAALDGRLAGIDRSDRPARAPAGDIAARR